MFDKIKQAFAGKLGGPDFDASMQATSHVNRSEAAKTTGISTELRDALFDDTPLPALLKNIGPGTLERKPWSIFAQAQQTIVAGHPQEAIPLLVSVLQEAESRVQLLAWATLRKLGHQPLPERAKQVLGVVVEVPVENGLDLVAAYPEHAARYYNYSGAGVIWEAPDPRLDSQIDTLLAAGQRVVHAIGPWEGDRPAPPTGDRVRLNMLTPSGLHFGEGPMDLFTRDAMASPIIRAAFELMTSLMQVDKAARV